MKVLVTGANGFIGKNLLTELNRQEAVEVLSFEADTPMDKLKEYCETCDFVFHLAGVNRPQSPEEYRGGNYGFTNTLVRMLQRAGNPCPVMYASSIQAVLDNPYGVSKKAGEDVLLAHGRAMNAPVYIYRFPNVFGKWCRPNYNSVVATFCHNIARNLPIVVNDESKVLHLVYIDDVVGELLGALRNSPHRREDGFCYVEQEYDITLGELASLLDTFRESRRSLMVPDMTEDGLVKKLYSTYLSYLPEDDFVYPLTMHEDYRGSFTEVLRSADRGQVSINISKPGIVKGNHWHQSKIEKFLVVSGEALVAFRKFGEEEVIEYRVSGSRLEVIDIPPGYTHSLVNVGDTELVTLMWCNECYNPDKPDTIGDTRLI